MKIGTADATALYLGTTTIDKAYLGTTEVWNTSGGGGALVQTLTGAWTGLYQFVPSSNIFTKEVVDPTIGSDRHSQCSVRLWNGPYALQWGAVVNGNKSQFATRAVCGAYWQGTDPANTGPGFKVRCSFDGGTTWVWQNLTNTDAVVYGSAQATYLNAGGTANPNMIAAVTAASGGAQTDFYAGLPMILEVYDV